MSISIEQGILKTYTKKYWRQYDSPATFTADDIGMEIIEGGLYSLIDRLRKQFGELNGLDAMGQGSRFKQLGFQRAVALSLDFDEKRFLPVDRRGVTYFMSDITHPKTWERLMELGPYHLILFTPGGGTIDAWDHDEKKFSQVMGWATSTLQIGGTLIYVDGYVDASIPKNYILKDSYRQHGVSLSMTSEKDKKGRLRAKFSLTRLS